MKQLLKLRVDTELTGRCVAVAHRHFLLDEGVGRYQAIYESFAKSE